jgi:hypothetical protein
VVALVFRRGLRVALPVFAVALVAIGVWWDGLRPSNERDWQPEVAKLAYATIKALFTTGNSDTQQLGFTANAAKRWANNGDNRLVARARHHNNPGGS